MAKKQDEAPRTVKVTLKRSAIGQSARQGKTLISMGFRRLNQTIELQDTASTRGMIAKVSHLVSVDEQG